MSDCSTSQRAVPSGPSWSTRTRCSARPSAPTAALLLTGSTDGTARLWAVPGGEPLARPLDLHRTVNLVAFAPDGRSLVTQDGDLVRLWALPEEGVPMTRVPLDGKNSFAALSPDGALAIPTGMSFAERRAPKHAGLSRCDRPTGRAAAPPRGPDRRRGLLARWAIGRHRSAHATVHRRRGRRSWSGTGRAAGERWRAALPSEPRSLSYRPDGRRLAVLCGGGELLVFDPDRRPRGPPLARPRRRARSPLDQQRQGQLQPRRP